MDQLDNLKTALIRSEIARRGAVEADTVEMILESLTVVSPSGAVVSRDGGKPLEVMFADLRKDNPDYFEAPKPARPSVVLDPTKPGFNLTAAVAAARNDPEAYAELMERLAPRPAMPQVSFR